MSNELKVCHVKAYLGDVLVGEHRMPADPIEAAREFGMSMRAVNYPVGNRFEILAEQSGAVLERWLRNGDDWRQTRVL